MSDEIVWEEPAYDGRSSPVREFLEAVRQRPGAWAKLPVKNAHQKAANLKRGSYKWFKAADYELTARQIDGETFLYARFIGKPVKAAAS